MSRYVGTWWYFTPMFWEVFFVDWVSKRLAPLVMQNPIRINQYFSFELFYNRGVAFSLFQSYDRLSYALVTLCVFCILVWFIRYTMERQKQGFSVYPEILILAGGIGNFFDRLAYGAVVDFIHISYGAWSFPVFNVADIAITFGVFMILYDVFTGSYFDNE